TQIAHTGAGQQHRLSRLGIEIALAGGSGKVWGGIEQRPQVLPGFRQIVQPGQTVFAAKGLQADLCPVLTRLKVRAADPAVAGKESSPGEVSGPVMQQQRRALFRGQAFFQRSVTPSEGPFYFFAVDAAVIPAGNTGGKLLSGGADVAAFSVKA